MRPPLIILPDKNPIPSRWKPVEPVRIMAPPDMDKMFHDWTPCTHCEKGVLVETEQKNGYSVKKNTKCPVCNGQGGWHKTPGDAPETKPV